MKPLVSQKKIQCGLTLPSAFQSGKHPQLDETLVAPVMGTSKFAGLVWMNPERLLNVA